MGKITFDYSKTAGLISEEEIGYMSRLTEQAKDVLVSKNGAGNDFLGWIDLPVDYDKEEFSRIEKAAEKIKKDSDVLIVIGIGGSYLGARAAIEFLRHGFYNSLPKEKRGTPEIYYVGNSISSTYLQGVIDVIGDRDFSVNVISKSGTTTEPAIAFRIFKKMLEDKYGQEEAAKRIYATTDKARGALKDLATKEGYESFVVPDDVGGRFSVLTAVGLLPIAVSGADIKALMDGAASGRELALNEKFEDNEAMKYAAIRNILLRKGKSVEVLANYEPALHYIGEWWKQLYGESEGKDQKGIFPAAVDLTTDLHSMGQFIQDGSRIMFETVMELEEPTLDVTIQEEPVDLDGIKLMRRPLPSARASKMSEKEDKGISGAKSRAERLYMADRMAKARARKKFQEGFVVLDIETTGTSPEKDEIIEVGALKIEAGTVTEEFSMLIQIKGEIPIEIQKLTGITEQELQSQGRPLDEVLNKLFEFLMIIINYFHVFHFHWKFSLMLNNLKNQYIVFLISFVNQFFSHFFYLLK